MSDPMTNHASAAEAEAANPHDFDDEVLFVLDRHGTDGTDGTESCPSSTSTSKKRKRSKATTTATTATTTTTAVASTAAGPRTSRSPPGAEAEAHTVDPSPPAKRSRSGSLYVQEQITQLLTQISPDCVELVDPTTMMDHPQARLVAGTPRLVVAPAPVAGGGGAPNLVATVWALCHHFRIPFFASPSGRSSLIVVRNIPDDDAHKSRWEELLLELILAQHPSPLGIIMPHNPTQSLSQVESFLQNYVSSLSKEEEGEGWVAMTDPTTTSEWHENVSLVVIASERHVSEGSSSAQYWNTVLPLVQACHERRIAYIIMEWKDWFHPTTVPPAAVGLIHVPTELQASFSEAQATLLELQHVPTVGAIFQVPEQVYLPRESVTGDIATTASDLSRANHRGPPGSSSPYSQDRPLLQAHSVDESSSDRMSLGRASDATCQSPTASLPVEPATGSSTTTTTPTLFLTTTAAAAAATTTISPPNVKLKGLDKEVVELLTHPSFAAEPGALTLIQPDDTNWQNTLLKGTRCLVVVPTEGEFANDIVWAICTSRKIPFRELKKDSESVLPFGSALIVVNRTPPEWSQRYQLLRGRLLQVVSMDKKTQKLVNDITGPKFDVEEAATFILNFLQRWATTKKKDWPHYLVPFFCKGGTPRGALLMVIKSYSADGQSATDSQWRAVLNFVKICHANHLPYILMSTSKFEVLCPKETAGKPIQAVVAGTTSDPKLKFRQVCANLQRKQIELYEKGEIFLVPPALYLDRPLLRRDLPVDRVVKDLSASSQGREKHNVPVDVNVTAPSTPTAMATIEIINPPPSSNHVEVPNPLPDMDVAHLSPFSEPDLMQDVSVDLEGTDPPTAIVTDSDIERFRLEEDVLVLEAALAALNTRKQDIDQAVNNKSDHRISIQQSVSDLETRVVRIRARQEEQSLLLQEITQSLERCQGSLDKLLEHEVDISFEEIRALSSSRLVDWDGELTESVRDEAVAPGYVPVGNPYDDPKRPGVTNLPDHENPSPMESLLGKEDDAVSKKLSVQIPLYDVDRFEPVSSSVCADVGNNVVSEFWLVEGDISRRMASFIPCVGTETSIRDILDTASREILVADSLDVHALHRIASFWNSCLDVKLLSTIDRSDGAVEISRGSLNSSVPICPYELSGVCADPFCSYQHFHYRPFGRILARELLPLPILPLILETPVPSFEKGATVSEYGDRYGDTEVVAGSVGDDFIRLPMLPEADSVGDSDEEELAKPADFRSASMCVWWEAKGLAPMELGSVSETISLFGFTLSTSDASKGDILHLTSPTDLSEACSFVGRVLDCQRLAFHAGRFDVAAALNTLSRREISRWQAGKNGNALAVDQVARICLTILNAAEIVRKCNLRFDSAPQRSVFELPFDSQILLALVSCYLKGLHAFILRSTPTQLQTALRPWFQDASALLALAMFLFTRDDNGHKLKPPPFLKEGSTSMKPFHEVDCDVHSVPGDVTTEVTEESDILKNNRLQFLLEEIAKAFRLRGLLGGKLYTCTVNEALERAFNAAKLALSCSSQVELHVLTSVVCQLGCTVLGTLTQVANALKGSNGDSMKVDYFDVYKSVDRILLYLRGLRRHDAMIEVVVAPLFAANVALATCVRAYDKVNLRLELLLWKPAHGTGRFGFMHLSELLWSQFAHLRSNLPRLDQIERGAADGGSAITADLPVSVSGSNAAVAKRIYQLGVRPHHLSLGGDWNLVRELNPFSGVTSKTSDQKGLGGTAKSAALKKSCLQLVRAVRGLVDAYHTMEFSWEHMPLSRRQTYGQAPVTTSVVPGSLFVAGRHLQTLRLNDCTLTQLPLLFGHYFCNLKVLELKNNRLVSLPSTLSLIAGIEILAVDGNSLDELPSPFRFPMLKTFTAKRNAIRELPDSLKECRELEVVDVSNNPIRSDPGVFASQLPRLRIFSWGMLD